MSQDQQPRQQTDKRLEVGLLLAALLLAWPAFLLAVVSRYVIKRHTDDPFIYWLSAGILGTVGAWVLYSHANPSPLLLILSHDIGPLVLHLSTTTGMHFVHDALPLWERSILLFPWVTLVIELFTSKSLEATLLTKARRRKAIQARKSQWAARKAVSAPLLANKKGVFGVLIDDPNE